MIKKVNTFTEFLKAIEQIDAYNSYMSYAYFSVFCGFHPEMEDKFVAFIVIDDIGEIVGALPLYKRRIGYVILGYRYSNYLGYVCTKENIEDVHNEMIIFLSSVKERFVINFYDINSNDILFQQLSSNDFSKKTFLYGCPFTDTDVNFNDFFVRQIGKSKKRSELKKFYRKLSEIGKIEVIHIDNEDSWERSAYLFPQIFSIHKKRFSQTFIPDNLCLYKNEKYYTKLFENLVKKEKAYISILTLDEHVISFLCASVSNRVIQDWIPAFDPAFSKYCLGTVHLMKIFEYVCESEKYDIFDFSKGDGTYKDRWCNGKTSNYAFVVRNMNTPLSMLEQKLILVPYDIKAFLRKKGYLSKIKKAIVKIKGDGCQDDRILSVERCQKKEPQFLWHSFSYENVSIFEENIATSLLSEYYSEKYEYFAVRNNQIYLFGSQNNSNQ